jgi:hypothetical protein
MTEGLAELKGTHVTFLPHYFLFLITCPVMSFHLPHLVLTITAYLVHFTLINPFIKPRTVLLSIFLFLLHVLPIAPTILPIPSSLYPRMYYT